MSRNFIECAKCHQNAETEPNRNEFTHSYAIRDKDGKIYCWYCYKGFSHCKGCQKSVANLKFPRSGNPYYPHASGYSINCERVENKVEFICSQKCADKLSAEKYQAWKNKLNQGWTKCPKCLDLHNWVKEISKEWREKSKENFMKDEEKYQSYLVKLVPPGEEKLCKNCKHRKEVEEPRKKEIRAGAQKYWDTLPYETRLSEVKRTGSVGWGNFYKSNLDAEGIAAQGEVPYGIVYEFELRDCHHDCSDCHLDKDFQNSTTGNANLSCSSSNENETKNTIINKLSDKETQLQTALEKGENSEKINSLKNDIKNLKDQARNNQQQKEENKNPLGDKYSGLIIGGIAMVFLLSLATILVAKGKKNKK